MTRLVVKRTPWWVAHRKLVFVWLPLASLQAATLAGLGYFYYRLNDLEQKAETSVPVTPETPVVSVPIATPEPVIATPPTVPVMPEQPVIAATPASPPPTHDIPDVRDTKVSPPTSLPPVKPEPARQAPIASVKPVKPINPPVKPAPTQVKRDVKTKPVAPTHNHTATANHSRNVVRQLTNTMKTPNIEPLPAQVDKVWVYLGELRDYGWHDQKLHIPPKSGLPAVGRIYLTQYIATVHAAPYGRQLAGKFHLGERVLLHAVRYGYGNDVWGLVSAQ